MPPIVTFKTPPSRCEYLPVQQRQLQYELRRDLRSADYMQRLKEGWRRIGPVMFQPDCEACDKCLSLRIPVATFRPSNSQRRSWNRNEGAVKIGIGTPIVTPERLKLFSRFHEHGHRTKEWPAPEESSLDLFVANPFPTEEWSYWIDDRLVGVGYVDALSEGLSAIYFFHDPDHHRRSLGTFHILNLIETARQRQLPHAYLGYYVEGCRSLEYKARFKSNEVRTKAGWKPFVPR